MSDLTELEVLDRLRESLREAVDACKDLAIRKQRQEAPYARLREHLRLIEGCCRQLGAFRGDTRWLPIGMMMGESHKSAGKWLRGYKKNGVHIVVAVGQMNEMFTRLGGNLMAIGVAVDRLAHERTDTTGPILPAAPAEERRIGRPSFETQKKKPTLILPARLAATRG